MDTLPEFVKETEPESSRRIAYRQLTGWETVVFQLDDEEPEPALSSTMV